MSDKTQLEQIAELLVGHCFMPPDHDLDTGDMELEMARNVAQQILDICQPHWIPVDGHSLYDRQRVIVLAGNWYCAYWNDVLKEWRDPYGGLIDRVTHYMIPELPEDAA